MTPRTWGLKIMTILGNFGDLGALGENRCLDHTDYILGIVSQLVFKCPHYTPQTPSRHRQTPSRHPQTPSRQPPRHSSGTLQMTSTAILDFVSLYVFITPNTPYRHPRDTPRHPRPPLYTACTPSRHPPDALYSHRWCPNKITQCTLGCFILR